MTGTPTMLRYPAARIALFLGLSLACGLAVQLCGGLAYGYYASLVLHRRHFTVSTGDYFGEAAGAVGVVAALALMRRLGDADIPWRSWFAPRGALGQALVGVALMAALTLLRAGILYSFGLYRITGALHPALPWWEPTYLVMVAFLEETAFRGYVFRKIEAAGGPWRALVLSSALFGLIHLNNYAPTWGGRVLEATGACVGGLAFGASYLLTRHLWLPIGLHFMYDYSEDVLFGAGDFADGTQWLTTTFRGVGLSADLWLRGIFDIALALALLWLVVRHERQQRDTERTLATATP